MTEPTTDSDLELWQFPVLSWNDDPDAPSVFISYSQTQDKTNAHRNWVAMLAMKMAKLGVNIYHDSMVDGHESFSEFMDNISKTKFVICVCSDSYVKKANDKNARTGVIWEIENLRTRGRSLQPLPSFIIPIIKDGSSVPFPDNLPSLIASKDIRCHSFETTQCAKGSFATIIDRIFGIQNKIREKIPDSELYRKFGQKILVRYYKKVASFWIVPLDSPQEEDLLSFLLSEDIYNIHQTNELERRNDEETNVNSQEMKPFADNYSDPSYAGDNEIVSLLAGGDNNE